MIAKNITFRNFKSFGNNEQTIELDTDSGQLILLVGRNGAGKSSIIDGFEYVLFNQVRKKRKKGNIKLGSLPNRINKDMSVKIEFLSNLHNNTSITTKSDIIVERGQNPKKLSLLENNRENERAGASNIDDLIQKHIGYDSETFKSFISISIADFSNFLSLSADDKKILLDKLFNLDIINQYNYILNSVISETQRALKGCDSTMGEIDISIDDLTNRINVLNQKIERSKSVELNTLEEKIKETTPKRVEVESKLEKIKALIKELSDRITSMKLDINTIDADMRNLNTQIELFNNDKCPTCESDLSSDFHRGLKKGYLERLANLKEKRVELFENGKQLVTKQQELETKKAKGESVLSELKATLQNLSAKYTYIKESLSIKGTEELELAKKSLEVRKESVESEKSVLEDKKVFQGYIKKILGEDGVRKEIITAIIDPINYYIKENCNQMNLPFEVILDESFNATVTTFGEEVDTDTLSEGENKKCNLAILVAYLILIRTRHKINILFLDEVFASIDIESVEDVLSLFKHMAETTKVNIFLSHHSILEEHFFGTIINVVKEVFTQLKYIKKKEVSNNE